jgi:oligoendopeptidase F
MELKSRKDMNPEYMWDFTHIYADKNAWEAALKEAAEAAKKAAAAAGTLGLSPEALKAGLDAASAAKEKTELCYIYAMLHKAADGGDPEYQEMQARALNLYVSLASSLAFFDPEILAIDPELLNKWLQLDELKTYRHLIDDITRNREHTLDDKTEQLLAKLSSAASTPSNAFDMLESVDMSFPDITDAEGNKVPLTSGTFGIYRGSPDRRVRKEAFELYFGEFARYKNTFCALYSGAVKYNNFKAEIKNYSSACEASLSGSNVPVSVYDSLIEAVHNSLPSMKKYLALRKKLLGLDELNMYDLYCPIVPGVDYKLSFEEAKPLVKKALEPLGADYARLLDRAYSEHWIDVYENKGKSTGAFSCGVYGVHPYIMLNYTDTLEDAFTLAHELGHAMHSYYSSEANEYINSDYKLLVAEVASTVNEILLARYLLKIETDPKRRAYIINRFLEGFRTTLYRQTLFAEFERKAHEMDASGQPLTVKNLSELYHELNCLYYQGVTVNDFTDIEWARIPHFYNSFYVYQYATGYSSAVSIANGILETGDASRYLKFLSLGGSDYPLEELKVAGVDLTKPDTVEKALKTFADYIDEFEELYKV